MSRINSTNAAEHTYPTYGRQFRSYKWYKPILVFLLFMIIYLILGAILTIAVRVIISSGTTNVDSNMANVFAQGYDDMELANAWQSLMNLGSVALMIPALWLASKIVRDRPFTSYSSARGGWSSKVFWKVFPIAFICVSVPIIVMELFYRHHLGDFQMKFTLASFIVVTILGPLQCIAEEYAFRGLLMQTFGSWFRIPVVAAILQAVVFVLVHPYDNLGKADIFITGTVFALCAWFGRGIEVSSAFHICNNMAIFYLQGMNMATITQKTTVDDFVVAVVCGIVYTVVIFIISKKTNWFDKIRKDDLGKWNRKIDEKIARKEAKKAAKNGPSGEYDESASGKHFKQ